MGGLGGLRERAGRRLRDPVGWTEVLQMLKTASVAVLAWVIASRLFHLPQPFLAPWAALLVVNATAYRSVWKGAKQITAAVLGIVVAWGTGSVIGLDPVALGVMLLAALASGRTRWLREEPTTVAATALIVLTTGYSTDVHMLLGRLVDTSVGVAVGIVVNVLVWPPLRDLTAARAIEAVGMKIGDLLAQMAHDMGEECLEDQVEAWVSRTQELDEHVDEAWALVRQARESGRLNPRKNSAAVREPGEFGEILDRTEQAIAEIRSMARTLGYSITDTHEWEEEFRHRWLRLLREVAWAIQNPDADRLGEIRTKLRALAADCSDEDLSAQHWPEYGGLILNLRNLATSMDLVAASDPVSASLRGPLRPAAL